MLSTMYILDSNDQLSPISSSPPPMAVELHTPDNTQMSLKRKRGFEADDGHSFRSLASPLYGQVPLPTPAPSFSSSFCDGPPPFDPSRLTHPLQRNLSSDSRNSKRLQLSPKPRLARHMSHLSSDLSSMASLVSPTTTTACHICQRRPSTRQDLPAYADCEVCGLRTCHVCIRTCEGLQCQSTTLVYPIGLGLGDEEPSAGKRICASCCIEVGSEGRVWCFACYHDDTEPELYNPKRSKEELEVESACRISDWLHRSDHDVDPGSSPASFAGLADEGFEMDQ